MEKRWYVVQTYAGYENKVMTNLLKRIETMNMQEKIFRVLIPEEKEVKTNNVSDAKSDNKKMDEKSSDKYVIEINL